MGYKAKAFGTTRVELSTADYWCDVAPLTKAEDDECRRVLLGGDLEASVNDMAGLRARFHQREYTDALLCCAIKAWNLDDEAGNVLPIAPEHVQGLREADSSKLVAVVRGLTNPLADEAKAQD